MAQSKEEIGWTVTSNKFAILIAFLFFLFIVILQLSSTLRTTDFFLHNAFARTMLFYMPVIASLACLCLSIYAYIKTIEPLRKYGRPFTLFCIVVSSFFLLCTVIPLIWSYLASYEVKQILEELRVRP
jgi:hypothetical protein